MGQVEILLATVHRNNHQFIETMHIQSDIVIANQSDHYEQTILQENGKIVKFITTPDQGVGKNRNLALSYSQANYCALADDDMVYSDGYETAVIHAFEEIPKADILIFNCEEIGTRADHRKITKVKRVHIWNFGRYGTYRIVINRARWRKNPVFFSESYGGGTVYSAGEDTLFLRECLKKGMKIYTYPYCLAAVNQNTSTWFRGYNEKYFYDKGALLAEAFPIMKYCLALYFACSFRQLTELSFHRIISYIFSGIKNSRYQLSYDDLSQHGGKVKS